MTVLPAAHIDAPSFPAHAMRVSLSVRGADTSSQLANQAASRGLPQGAGRGAKAEALGASAAELLAEGVLEYRAAATPLPTPPPFDPNYRLSAERTVTVWAYQFESRVFPSRSTSRPPIGVVRRGTVLPARADAGGSKGVGRGASEPRCAGRGLWLALGPGAYVCTGDGFGRGRMPSHLAAAQRSARGPLEYTYAEVLVQGLPRLWSAPSPTQRGQLVEGQWHGWAEPGAPSWVDEVLEGTVFVALERTRSASSRRQGLVRTVRGRYVPAAGLGRFPLSSFAGEALATRSGPVPVRRDPDRLKHVLMAFLPRQVPLWRWSGDGHLRAVGFGQAFVRFRPQAHRVVLVLGNKGLEERVYVRHPQGAWLRMDDLRVAYRRPRPAEVEVGERWLYIDREQQTLTAYEGDEPRYVTLVSSGRRGYETPVGTFRVREKYRSKTMQGDDANDGPYEIEEVPWIQYYDGGFALHGAYWHENFGEPQSHGCVNLSPRDARWLFRWTSPRLPERWQGIRLQRGTWVVIERRAPQAVTVASS